MKNTKKGHFRGMGRKSRKYGKKSKFILLKNQTSKQIQQMSIITNRTNLENPPKDYYPSINASLLSLKSLPRIPILKCNLTRLLMEEPLEIEIDGKCILYSDPLAKQILYRGLQANKHINMSRVVPPAQRAANCWFNAFFVTFFISDKGRVFFHFFRELMISGKQHDGTPIPDVLRDAFALLNFAIESSLSGSEYAYVLNTNAIIQRIYDSIHDIYKVGEPGNPIYYYMTIMNYLNNHDAKMCFIQNAQTHWKEIVHAEIANRPFFPNVLILEYMEDDKLQNKESRFSIQVNGTTVEYELDSAVIRDTDKMHFCALITGEQREYGFDGYTYHRIVPFSWKQYLNRWQEWGYEGSFKDGRSLFRWNFLNGYQLLIYYRIL